MGNLLFWLGIGAAQKGAGSKPIERRHWVAYCYWRDSEGLAGSLTSAIGANRKTFAKRRETGRE